ncbi:MAG: pitrilysin family protein [Pseudomonadota bacterium]
MRHLFTALAGASLLVLGSPAVSQPVKPVPVADLVKHIDIAYQQFTLPNGLRVVVHTDRKAPVVALSIWYDVGSKFEPAGKTGYAHLFEHLMFYGSENAPGPYFESMAAVGATDYNGTTYFDRTNYYETVPTPALDRLLFLESDRMGYLLGAITQAKLDYQRGVVQNEKRQRENQPYGLGYEKMIAGLFPTDHPYGHTTIGSMADLDAASLADVKGWFSDHYGPNNAVLVLAGDIDLATAKQKVAQYFGPIARGPASVAPKVAVPTLAAAKRETITDRVANVRITRAWAVPGTLDKDYAALTVAASALGGLASSRLDNALVRNEKIAVSVSTYYEDFANLGHIVIDAEVKPGVDPALVEKRLDELTAQFLREGPSADEILRTTTQIASGRIAGLESVGGGGKATTLAEGTLYAGDPGFFKKQLAAIAATTPAQVRTASQRWLGRPMWQLTTTPGPRAAYAETKVAASVPPPTAAPVAAAAGTRGALPGVGEIARLAFPATERATLSNGIKIVYARRDAVPFTFLNVSFDAGAVADPVDALGTQSLTLAAMNNGTTTRDSATLAADFERVGAFIGSGSSADTTSLGLSVPSANLTPALAILGDVIRNPAFDPAEVDRLRNQQLSRIRQELTSPNALANRAMAPLLYGPANPYAKASFGNGDPAAVAKLTRDDLIAFRSAWLRPDTATVFVVSSEPLATVTAALEATLGDWRPTGAAGVKAAPVAAPAGARVLLIDRPDSPQSVIRAAIPNTLDGQGDLLAYQTANDVFGSDTVSRLSVDLRESKGWSYGAYSQFARNKVSAPFQLTAPVQADKTGLAVAAIRDDIAGYVGKSPTTQAEYDRVIGAGVNELSGNYETAQAVLSALQGNALYNRPDDYQATLADRYRKLTIADLDTAARATLDPAKLIFVVVGDAKVVKPQLDSLGIAVEIVAPATLAALK